MTALLVIFTVLAFVGADFLKLYIKRRRGLVEVPAAAPVRAFSPVQLPSGLFVADNHSWVRLTETGELRLGMDELLTQSLGDVDQVTLPRPGTEIRRGEVFATIRRLGHEIPVVSPVDGTVVAANEMLVAHPFDAAKDPYGNGWIASIWPTDHAESLRDLRVGERAAAWMKNEMQRLSDFLTMRAAPNLAGATLSDGARPIVGVLNALDDGARQEFMDEFLKLD